MDGVPGLTQDAVAPGDSFDYDFEVPDAGTYWYHSHECSAEQVARGLYGALIVEEATSSDIDREEVLILDGLRGWVVAFDGMPLKTPVPIDGELVLATAQRADLIVDVTANSGETAYLAYIEGNQAYVQVRIPVRGAASTALRPAPRALSPNPQLEPDDLSSTVKARLVMEGGAMGGMRNAVLGLQRRGRFNRKSIDRGWAR